MTLNSQEGYALWAATYDDEKNPLITVEEPRAKELLDKLNFSQVLDAATGTGRYSLPLARRGALVTAVDSCPEMLAAAREKAQLEGLKIDFRLLPLDTGLPFEDASFDLVVCALALSHISGLDEVIGEFSRVLKSPGHLLVTDFHPDFIARGGITSFTSQGEKYEIATMKHSREHYLTAFEQAEIGISRVIDILCDEVPEGCLPREIMQKYCGVNLCLIVLGSK